MGQGSSRRPRGVVPALVTVQRFTVLLMVAGTTLAFSPQALGTFSTVKTHVLLAGTGMLLAVAVARLVSPGVLPVPRLLIACGVALFMAGLLGSLAVAQTPAIAVFGTYKRHGGVLNYGGYLVVFLVVARTFTAGWMRALLWTMVATSAAVAAYGLMVEAGLGPAVVREVSAQGLGSTLGNPNFAAAAIAVGVAPLVWAMLDVRTALVRSALALLGGVMVLALVMTNSLQGMIAAAAGVSLIALAWGRARAGWSARVAVLLWAVGAGCAGAVAALGLAREGPAAALGAERTFQLRLWDWQAAIAMFRASPLLGVGMDHYGQHYRQYRPLAAALDLPLEHGNDAAHNVALSMFANGGAVLGAGYLVFVGVTAWCLLHGLRQQEGPRVLLLGGVGGAWLAYQVQSLVSIDVPALALSHFVLAGAVVAASGGAGFHELRLPWWRWRKGRLARARDITAVLSGVAVVSAAVLGVGILFGADHVAGHGARAVASGNTAAGLRHLHKATELAPWEPAYRLQLGLALLSAEQYAEALAAFDATVQRDPSDFSALVTRARIAADRNLSAEAMNDYAHALRIEPQHPALKLEVARLARRVGEPQLAAELLGDVLAIDPENRDAARLARSLRK